MFQVDNLSYRTQTEDLRHAFEKYGDVGDVYIPRDRFTRESRGFAFVRLDSFFVQVLHDTRLTNVSYYILDRWPPEIKGKTNFVNVSPHSQKKFGLLTVFQLTYQP